MTSRSHRHLPSPERASSGFTLIESMIVVTIIGIIAASVMPAMTEMMANTRQQSAATRVMLLARQARREALLGGKYAYAVVIDANLNAMQIVTGLTGYCNRGSNINFGADPDSRVQLPRGWQSAIGGMTLVKYNLGPHVLSFSIAAGGGTPTYLRMCYAVNGDTFQAMTPTDIAVPQPQDVVVSVRREVQRVLRGVDRRIVFPIGGTARPL